MPALSLALFFTYGLLAVGLRAAVQLRRTGSTGFAGIGRDMKAVEKVCGLLLVIGVVSSIAGPALQLAGVEDPVKVLDSRVVGILGIVLALFGIAMTLKAQLAMGDAWRVGVNPSESTALVIDGPFSIVRNPIFAAMFPAFAGFALLAPSAVAIAGALLVMAALELQTRLVEEPYLLKVHGELYVAYAARVGRFLPGIGRLS